MIVTMEGAREAADSHRKRGQKIVQCHGCFDLLHYGHVIHLQRGKETGDILFVTVTSDRYVNKGPGRPAFDLSHRMAMIDALGCVDYVVASDEPNAVTAIDAIRPDFFVKGQDYIDKE